MSLKWGNYNTAFESKVQYEERKDTGVQARE